MTMEIMTLQHRRWPEFYNALGRLGTYRECDHTTNGAFEVLNLMKGFEIKRSIDGLRALGGKCDCEIMMNLPSCNSFD